jgi:hypothetical protein
VADATLHADRTDKVRIYGLARLPVYWIANIPDGLIEVYTRPKGGKKPGYHDCVKYGKDAAVPLVLDGAEVARLNVGDLLP